MEFAFKPSFLVVQSSRYASLEFFYIRCWVISKFQIRLARVLLHVGLFWGAIAITFEIEKNMKGKLILKSWSISKFRKGKNNLKPAIKMLYHTGKQANRQTCKHAKNLPPPSRHSKESFPAARAYIPTYKVFTFLSNAVQPRQRWTRSGW
jgi:hypothetical protein